MPIRVYTPYMDLLHETDNYLSLQFMPKFYDTGNFELHINHYMEGAEHFQKNNLIMLNKRNDKVMIIRHREIALDENGKASENWRITGTTLDGILNQRITIPPAHTAHDRKSGDAETVMKHYVEKHFVNPDDPDRKIDHIEIAPNLHRGGHVECESRFKDVDKEISTISKQSNLGFVMYADMVRKKWIFDVVEPRDVTQDNPTGLPPVFFSPDFQTIKSQQFVDSDINYKNYGYVGGQGEGTEREIVSIGNSKGLERIETFIDARDVGSSEEEELTPEEIKDMLIERGQQRLDQLSTAFYLEAQILTPTINENSGRFALKTPFEYEKDFRLGDIVEVFNKKWNITMDAPITELREVHEPGGFLLEATFGEAIPTLIKRIKSEFDKINGVEQQELPVQVAVRKLAEANQYTNEKLTEEEKARIEQAKANLEAAKEHTEEYAEKVIPEQPTEPDPTQHQKWVDTSVKPPQMKLWDGEAWTAVKGEKGEQGPQGPNKVDETTEIGPNWFVVEYIKSLYGLNINNQFVVDDNGNVSLGNDRVSIKAGGTDAGINIKNGAFSLEDDTSSMKYNVAMLPNLINDHSFEMVKSDGTGLQTVYHWENMAENHIFNSSAWRKGPGTPKVVKKMYPDLPSKFPMYGDQAIAVRAGDYVYQDIEVAINSTYTFSAFCKRQANVVAGGGLRLEVWAIDSLAQRIMQIANQSFPNTKSDYTEQRHAVTFTVPNDNRITGLQLVINGTNVNWIQVDGVQLVAGTMPSLYAPEDSLWKMHNGIIPNLNRQRILWSGAYYMQGGQTIYPAKKIGDCANGWILVWSDYDSDTASANNFNWVMMPVFRDQVIRYEGQGAYFPVPVSTPPESLANVYLYLYNDRISGNDLNSSTPTMRDQVLRTVYEW
jgi:hypothetical protein